MKNYLLSVFALSFHGALFAFSGSGTSDDPWYIYGTDVYNKDVAVSQSGYYRPAHQMNSFTAAQGGNYIFVNGDMRTGSFTNLGYSRFESITLDITSGNSNFGNLTEFVGTSSPSLTYGKLIFRANSSIYGTANFYDNASLSVVSGYSVKNFGNIRFLTGTGTGGSSNNFTVEGSFTNNALVEIQKGSINITGTFINSKDLVLASDSEVFLRGHGSLVSNSIQGLNLYNLTTEASTYIEQTSAETLQINNYAHLAGTLTANGNLRLNSGEFSLGGTIELSAGGSIELANAKVDFITKDIKTSVGELVDLVLADGSDNVISYLNQGLEFANLGLNNANLTIDALNPFIIKEELWGSGDYGLIINNFTEDRIFIASLDENFDLTRVSALDENGNDLGRIYYSDGYLTLVPEPSAYVSIFGVIALSLVLFYRRRKLM